MSSRNIIIFMMVELDDPKSCEGLSALNIVHTQITLRTYAEIFIFHKIWEIDLAQPEVE